MHRRTKIVATVGPASCAPDTLRTLIRTGVDVFRLNFSHGTHDSHREMIAAIRAAGADVGREVGLLQDLCGPKIRTGKMQEGGVDLVEGRTITVTTEDVEGTAERFTTQYKALPADVKPGAPIILDDGNLELKVLETGGHEVRCEIVRGGLLKSNKGMNLPGTHISTPSVTEKDMDDLMVGIEEGVDFVALSFVRHPYDIIEVRRTLDRHGKHMRLIAKIEKPEALEHLDEIIEAADGVMIARGDLGVEMDLASVPVIQKDIIRRAAKADKYIVTATQMLESMVTHATPTRAEVSDVANAILDGTDAIMLSGETAAGAYPVAAVGMMDRIAKQTESFLEKHPPNWDWGRLNAENPVQDAIGHAAYQLYRDLDVKAIITFSATGGTALFLSKGRPFSPILAFTSRADALRQMRIFWGVEPILDESLQGVKELRRAAVRTLKAKGIATDQDNILLVTGTEFGRVGGTNRIEIMRVGDLALG